MYGYRAMCSTADSELCLARPEVSTAILRGRYRNLPPTHQTPMFNTINCRVGCCSCAVTHFTSSLHVSPHDLAHWTQHYSRSISTPPSSHKTHEYTQISNKPFQPTSQAGSLGHGSHALATAPTLQALAVVPDTGPELVVLHHPALVQLLATTLGEGHARGAAHLLALPSTVPCGSQAAGRGIRGTRHCGIC